MSKTMAVHLRYNYFAVLFKTTTRNSQILHLCGELEPRPISNLSLCYSFSFVIALTVINKVNDFTVPRDS